ncbi:5-formyltetrahydrofolate cyclo-ligase [Clostridium mediterraneense]|uniref:5-formyltetrahydrofolate cyclo-ligase n=1 Tax=Clostridium mediterraneense TaxID=1805472 RepID=UPI0008356157|nr:5-formyltetrahydrofolate cyclo-ligase [Clostridium mediterraneense]
MNKQYLRQSISEIRRNMDKEEKLNKDTELREKLFNTDEYKNSKVIFVYVSMGDEINTIEIIKRLFEDKKVVAVPKVFKNPKRMEALRIDSFDDLNQKGPFGILEPSFEAENISDLVDLTIVPGLAFELSGKRVGYGGGYYDKFFKSYPKSKKVALCYDYQIVENTYPQDYDQGVDKIISNNKIIDCL